MLDLWSWFDFDSWFMSVRGGRFRYLGVFLCVWFLFLVLSVLGGIFLLLSLLFGF